MVSRGSGALNGDVCNGCPAPVSPRPQFDGWRLSPDLAELAGEAPEMVVELIETFVEDGRQRLGTIRDAVSAGSREVFQREAHSLKGAASQIGAARLAASCRQFEDRKDADSAADLAELARHLEEQFDTVANDLLAYRLLLLPQ